MAPIADTTNASPGIRYVTPSALVTTLTALDRDFVVAEGAGHAFTVNLPVATAGNYVQTQPTQLGSQGPQYALPFREFRVTVRNNMAADNVTVKTTDGSTVDGIAGATGAVFAQYSGGTFYTDSAGNWVCGEGTHT